MTDMILEYPFEKAGLGKPPFRFVGVVELPSPSLAAANPDAYNNALRMVPQGIGCGSCQYCGQPIMVNCIIADANGRRFAVGSDCVFKTNSEGKLISAVKKAMRDRRTAKREAIRQGQRDARAVARAAELDRQRAVNGGKTDDELLQDRSRASMEDVRARMTAANGWLIEVLKRQGGGFCASMAKELETRAISALSPRCQSILQDIYGREAGRAGSRAYLAKVQEFEEKAT